MRAACTASKIPFAAESGCCRLSIQSRHHSREEPCRHAAFAHWQSLPTEQRVDPQQHFLFVDRLDHIIIGSNQKTSAFLFWELLSRNHENRRIIPTVSQLFRERIPVHLRHHDIENNQIDMLPIRPPPVLLNRLLPQRLHILHG